MNGIKLHVTRNKQIQEAIVVVVAPRGTGGPTTESDTGFVCDIGEGAVVVVVQEHGAWGGFLARQCSEGRTVHQVDVEPAVIVVVKQGHAGTRGFKNSRLFRTSRAMVKLVESGLLRDIKKNQRGAINKPPGSDGTGLRVFNRGMRSAGRNPHWLGLLWLVVRRVLRHCSGGEQSEYEQNGQRTR